MVEYTIRRYYSIYRLDSFFQTWELHGRFPKLLDDVVVGQEARQLYDDAKKMMASILDENTIEVNSVYGFWEAYSDEKDDIHLMDNKGNKVAISHTLRQQSSKSAKAFNMSLSDFICPKLKIKKII